MQPLDWVSSLARIGARLFDFDPEEALIAYGLDYICLRRVRLVCLSYLVAKKQGTRLIHNAGAVVDSWGNHSPAGKIPPAQKC